MKNFERLALDGHALRLFLAVLEEGSVTAAAERLDLTQSAVSHALKRLNDIVGVPLFVKAGRGITPTAHATALRETAQTLLAAIEQFGSAVPFRPDESSLHLTIAANDLQRDLLLPALFKALEAGTHSATLRVIPSEVPAPELLREGKCDLVISPFPPAGTDIVQKLLFRDQYVCFYDGSVRAEPRSRADYLAARHVTVIYPNNERLDFDKRLQAANVHRDIAIAVPGFSAIPAFLLGTDRLATMPRAFAAQMMRDFAQTSAPLDAMGAAKAGELTLFMAWHRRVQDDPRHLWVREKLLASVPRGTGKTHQ